MDKLYKRGLSLVFSFPRFTAMMLCLCMLGGAPSNAQQEQKKKAEIPVYNTQIPVYNAPVNTSRAPLVRQHGGIWAHPAPFTSATHDTKKSRGTPFKPKERAAPFSAGPGLFADICNSQKEIVNPKLSEICETYKNRPLDATMSNSRPSSGQR